MIVKLKENKEKNEIEVLIEYPVMTDAVKRIESAIKSVNKAIKCKDYDGQTILVRITDIFYIESIDKHTFIYCTNKVYECDFRLYILMDKLEFHGFAQISKSCILNLNTLISVIPMFNAKMEAVLTNGEKVVISRKYLPQIKKKLESLII